MSSTESTKATAMLTIAVLSRIHASLEVGNRS